MGNSGGTLKNHLETAEKTGALNFSAKNLKECPPQLAKVSNNLRNLDLSNNKIPGIPSWIGNFKMLKTLNLSQNKIVSLPDEFGNLMKLEVLILSDNLLRGLPDSVKNLKNLKDINLSGNQMNQFPMSLINLKNLNTVDLSRNKLTQLPPGLENLQITELSLNQNQVSSISADISKCKRLKTLRLEENCLSLDAIPKEIFEESLVSTLCVAGNLFEEKKMADVEGYDKYMERYTAVKRKLD